VQEKCNAGTIVQEHSAGTEYKNRVQCRNVECVGARMLSMLVQECRVCWCRNVECRNIMQFETMHGVGTL
jgi:hypothetical protein